MVTFTKSPRFGTVKGRVFHKANALRVPDHGSYTFRKSKRGQGLSPTCSLEQGLVELLRVKFSHVTTRGSCRGKCREISGEILLHLFPQDKKARKCPKFFTTGKLQLQLPNVMAFSLYECLSLRHALVSFHTPSCHNGPKFLETCFEVRETSFQAKIGRPESSEKGQTQCRTWRWLTASLSFSLLPALSQKGGHGGS